METKGRAQGGGVDQAGVPTQSPVRRPSRLRRAGQEHLPPQAPGFRTQQRKTPGVEGEFQNYSSRHCLCSEGYEC